MSRALMGSADWRDSWTEARTRRETAIRDNFIDGKDRLFLEMLDYVRPHPGPLPQERVKGRQSRVKAWHARLRCVCQFAPHTLGRSNPLIPSFSPNGGEGARRADEGVAVTVHGFDACILSRSVGFKHRKFLRLHSGRPWGRGWG